MTLDGKPWFVASDVCAFIELDHVPNACRALEESERRTAKRSDPITRTFFTCGRGTLMLTLITESGLYKLVMRAQRANPKAREFQDWVAKVVLPTIREHGS
ncbi:Bro-N domain-containing protein [Methylobacterium crusticola]|uniref:BRO-N domain-containing protein n=1 Tax=Methylobacterium crusticola TaxID=1697972 RepID=UPI001396C87C|nr:Bro-N domain-containing protein [Methylobacterium crusticola]